MAVTLESLKKTVGKKNANSRVFAWLADLEREAGNLDQALQRVDGGLTLYPSDVAAMLVRSKILFQKESYDACIEECEKVLVADPFNLAAQQIMGDAYDKLEKVGERNACYRRLHDMDPLNTFWKEEYDAVVDGVAAAAMAGAISDTDFSMPDGVNVDMGDGFTVEPSAEPAESAETAPSDEFSLDEPQVAETEPSGYESAEPAGDDPFAEFASMLPGNDEVDDSAMEDLSASLNSAMDSINSAPVADRPVEELSGDENISSSDVGSALSDMFGLEDDLEPEESSSTVEAPSDIPASIDDGAEANAASIFSTVSPASESPVGEDKPQSIDDAFGDIFGEDELPEEKPQEDRAAPAEDKPQSIDDAFGDIFGEDELPEEKPQQSDGQPLEKADAPSVGDSIADLDSSIDSEPLPDVADDDLELPSEDGGLFEKSADADMKLTGKWTVDESKSGEPAPVEAPVEDKPTSIDRAFEDIFGEDELPEEKPQVASAEETVVSETETVTLPDDLELPSEDGGLFEKSADADMKLTGEWTVDESKSGEPDLVETPVEDKPTTIDSAFENIFGEDELPEEKPVAEPAVEDESTAVESAMDYPVEPAEEPALESPAEESAPAPATDGFSVDTAFDSLFGDEDDLPEEKPQAEAETADSANGAQPEVSASLAEQVDKAEAELEMPEVKADDSDLAKEMGGAFASMFGSDDDDLDLPPARPEPVTDNVNDQEATGAAVEESFGNVQEDLSKELEDSFDSLFGKDEGADDSLNMDDSSMPTTADGGERAGVESPTDMPKDLDSLETEVSGAFKGLFDMDDDSLIEEEKPSNSGVDFLMSGDSDDEISAGLINNPDAPLDRGAYDLDESLNTPTLAEIYFDQGKYGKALEIYRDLAQKEPDNEEIAKRKDEIEKLYNEKFGGNA